MIPAGEADAELKRLDDLFDRAKIAQSNAAGAADKAAQAATAQATPGIRPLIQADLAEARRLDKSAHDLAQRLVAEGEKLSQKNVDQLYKDTRRVLDKAKLGKVDAVIGQ